ncbi:MAG: hypothetical protein EP318_07905 [Rhodobacteraceae bacterium]|nr:MAG: hypothetical protein EP318_07905 [Paracoccaceae bacterium]
MRTQEGEGGDDTLLKRIAKYVPAEILTGYTGLFAMLAALNVAETQKQWAAVGLIVIFLIVTIMYIRRNAPSGSVRQAHSIVSPIAFVALAYPISSSALLDWYLPIVAFFGQVIVIALSYFIKPVES